MLIRLYKNVLSLHVASSLSCHENLPIKYIKVAFTKI